MHIDTHTHTHNYTHMLTLYHTKDACRAALNRSGSFLQKKKIWKCYIMYTAAHKQTYTLLMRNMHTTRSRMTHKTNSVHVSHQVGMCLLMCWCIHNITFSIFFFLEKTPWAVQCSTACVFLVMQCQHVCIIMYVCVCVPMCLYAHDTQTYMCKQK